MPPKTQRHFSVTTPEESSGFLLWQVTSRWQNDIKKTLVEFGITHTQFVLLASMLWFADHRETVHQIKLSAHAQIDPMTTSMVVRTLESKGYVVRAGNVLDTRIKNISLTASGKKIAQKAVKKVERCDQDFFMVLGKETRIFNTLLTKLAR